MYTGNKILSAIHIFIMFLQNVCFYGDVNEFLLVLVYQKLLFRLEVIVEVKSSNLFMLPWRTHIPSFMSAVFLCVIIIITCLYVNVMIVNDIELLTKFIGYLENQISVVECLKSIKIILNDFCCRIVHVFICLYYAFISEKKMIFKVANLYNKFRK